MKVVNVEMFINDTITPAHRRAVAVRRIDGIHGGAEYHNVSVKNKTPSPGLTRRRARSYGHVKSARSEAWSEPPKPAPSASRSTRAEPGT